MDRDILTTQGFDCVEIVNIVLSLLISFSKIKQRELKPPCRPENTSRATVHALSMYNVVSLSLYIYIIIIMRGLVTPT